MRAWERHAPRAPPYGHKALPPAPAAPTWVCTGACSAVRLQICLLGLLCDACVACSRGLTMSGAGVQALEFIGRRDVFLTVPHGTSWKVRGPATRCACFIWVLPMRSRLLGGTASGWLIWGPVHAVRRPGPHFVGLSCRGQFVAPCDVRDGFGRAPEDRPGGVHRYRDKSFCTACHCIH